jgi:hypothetical protein
MTTPKLTVESGSIRYANPTPIESQICQIVSRSIRRSGITRKEICVLFAQRFGLRVTVSMLNDWTAASKAHTSFPVKLVDNFCEIVSDDSLQRFAAGKRLAKMIRLGENVAEMLAEDKQKPRKVRKS